MPETPAGKEVPFEFLVELVQAIATIPPKSSSGRGGGCSTGAFPSPAVRVFTNWVSALRERHPNIDNRTAATVFRLLFPEEDTARKYGMQETRLARHLAKIFGVCAMEGGRGQPMVDWCTEGKGDGCLGREVEKVLQAVCEPSGSNVGSLRGVSIAEIDVLLMELAATCPFSSSPVREAVSVRTSEPWPTPQLTPRKPSAILHDIFRHSSLATSKFYPTACSVLVQIILKDLRPLLYPLPPDAEHYRTALLGYKSNAVSVLTISQAMNVWDPTGILCRAWRSRGWAAFEESEESDADLEMQLPSGQDDLDDPEERAERHTRLVARTTSPVIGLPISIPKCVKGTGCTNALRSVLRSNPATGPVWAETKYDGERAQIHVQFVPSKDLQVGCGGKWEIKIYSKSGRDSTWDRAGIHEVIMDALGLATSFRHTEESIVKHGIVIEAEMVAFSDELGRIDEFWRIRSLVATTAIGPRHRYLRQWHRIDRENAGRTNNTDGDRQIEGTWSQQSLISNASDGGTRHLALVFFDVLMLDGASFVDKPYRQRRALLENIIRTRNGYAMLAERIRLGSGRFTEQGGIEDAAVDTLRRVMAAHISGHEEGVVLKAEESRYNDWRMPWVKLKKDYIPGYGDCVDLVLIGAGWNKERARELRVGPTVFTTFYIGARRMQPNVAGTSHFVTSAGAKPHFEILFTAEYGLSREALEELNFNIKSSDHTECHGVSHPLANLPYSYHIYHGIAKPGPVVLLEDPLLVEVMGAGFTKEPQSKYYTLRFPRIVKYHRRSERTWDSGISLDELQSIARNSVGRDRPGKAEEDWVKTAFGGIPSPGIRADEKKRDRTRMWVDKLEHADGLPRKRKWVCGDDSEDDTRKVKTRRESAVTQNVPVVEMDQSESKDLLVQSPRTPPQTKALGSVTNIFREFSSPSPTRPPTSASQSCSALHAPADVKTGFTTIAHLSPVHLQIGVGIAPETPAPGTTEESTSPPRIPHNIALRYAQTALGKLLSHSIVWIARSNAGRPTWRVSSRDIIPTGHRVHTLDALLVACRWTTSRQQLSSALPDWADCGVVFVDDGEDDPAPEYWTESRFPLRRLIEARSNIISNTGSGLPRACTIWVFGMRMLSVAYLNSAHETDEQDLEAKAICKLG